MLSSDTLSGYKIKKYENGSKMGLINNDVNCHYDSLFTKKK